MIASDLRNPHPQAGVMDDMAPVQGIRENEPEEVQDVFRACMTEPLGTQPRDETLHGGAIDTLELLSSDQWEKMIPQAAIPCARR